MGKGKRFRWGVVILASGLAATLAGAEPPEEKARPSRERSRMHQGSHAPLHAEMREQMRAHDARLDELVSAMNAAAGDAKVEAIAAVINELVAQRRTRRGHMEERWQRQQGRKGRPESKSEAP